MLFFASQPVPRDSLKDRQIMTESEYLELAPNYDLIPVSRERLADLDTAVTVLQRFRDQNNVFLLESMEGGEKWGRYSIIGVDPKPLLTVDHANGPTGAFSALRDSYRGLRVAVLPGLPRFFGGIVGFFAYEAGCEFENLPLPVNIPGRPPPASSFLRADRLIVFDNLRHTVRLIFCSRPHRDAASPAAAYKLALEKLDELETLMLQSPPPVSAPVVPPVTFSSNLTRDEFIEKVHRARSRIIAGDIIQVVISRHFSARCAVEPFQIYRALRFLNPSPYTFFLKINDLTLVGSSPEVMVRLSGSRVELRPIAGTRPRGASEQQDRARADELLSDAKEKAEHVMLVDLGRNDLGRISRTGSVQVDEYMTVERYSHVMHLVSQVHGILRPGLDALDVVAATFPAGTLSGAPKIRAMQIIHELETSPRGTYGGAIGYIGYDGNMDLAITIRTIELRGDTVSAQTGAGIVYDSDPATEYEETTHKARAMQQALAMVRNGLRPYDEQTNGETEDAAADR